MSEKINIAELKERTSIVDVVSKHVNLTRRGAEHIGLCPFHDDHRGSLKVNDNKGVFKCFACGATGDAIGFLQLKGYQFKEAVAEINGYQVDASGETRQRTAIKKKTVEWKQILPSKADLEIIPKTHYQHGEISQAWSYSTDEGFLIGYVCRFDLPDGNKEVVPLIFATDGKRREWRWQGFDKPRPLYNLKEIKNNPDKPILLVEGEKTCDAAKKLLPQVVSTTWIGGANAVKYTSWDLEGRDVIIWADKDIPGYEAMLEIVSEIRDKANSIRWVKTPTQMPTHWDLADADWTADQAFNYLKENLKTIKK